MELREKLRLALAAAPVRSAATLPRPARSVALAPRLPSPFGRRCTQAGDLWIAEDRWPLHYRHGCVALGDALDVEERALERLAPGLDRSALERAAFIDVETTGLGSGAGTVAFLIGIATFEGEGLALRQYFLATPAAEESMLAAILRSLDDCRAIVSYNGRSFDIPLLEARFVLSRLEAPFATLPHVDLLFPARRIYGGRLDSCRLRDVETAVLGVRREHDVAGWEIPRRYFDYLHAADAGPLGEVVTHNKLDVLSLVTLFASIGQVAGLHMPADALDALTLARWDETRGALPNAARLYRSALDEGLPEPEQMIATRRLIGVHRRLGQWDELEALLTRALDGRIASPTRLELLMELAKLKEHRRRDFSAAISLAREALGLADVLCMREEHARKASAAREDCHRRLRRLQRRSAKRLLRTVRPGGASRIVDGGIVAVRRH